MGPKRNGPALPDVLDDFPARSGDVDVAEFLPTLNHPPLPNQFRLAIPASSSASVDHFFSRGGGAGSRYFARSARHFFTCFVAEERFVDGSSWLPRPNGRRGQIEGKLLVGDVFHELPLDGEGSVVVARKLFQNQTAGFADAEWVLEQIDKCLGRQRWGIRFQCRLRGAEGSERRPRTA